MPSGSAFLLTYPSSVTVPSTLSTCQVIYNSQTYTMTSCLVNTSSRTIKISGGFATSVTAGASVKIQFSSVTNPSSYSTSSLTMVTYTDSTFTYTIDQIQSGLIPSFACT